MVDDIIWIIVADAAVVVIARYSISQRAEAGYNYG
jgi:hypothetical protein